MVFVSWLPARKKMNPSAHIPSPKIPEGIRSNITTKTIKNIYFFKVGSITGVWRILK